MTFFDQIYDQLFPKKISTNEVLLHEPIARSEQYQEQYARWIKSFDRKNLLNKIHNSYILKKQAVTAEPEVHLLISSMSNGFAISWNPNLNKRDFTYMFDWMADKVLELNYKKSNSDTTITNKGTTIETVSKHYLKPVNKPSTSGDLLDQQYGNILIEQILLDDKPSYIKLMANIYNDHKYNQALPFEKLAEFLFE